MAVTATALCFKPGRGGRARGGAGGGGRGRGALFWLPLPQPLISFGSTYLVSHGQARGLSVPDLPKQQPDRPGRYASLLETLTASNCPRLAAVCLTVGENRAAEAPQTPQDGARRHRFENFLHTSNHEARVIIPRCVVVVVGRRRREQVKGQHGGEEDAVAFVLFLIPGSTTCFSFA